MDMTKNKLTLLSVLSLCVLMIGLATSAGGGGSRGFIAESTEVLIGDYHCGVAFDDDTATSWVSLGGSGDVIARYLSLYRSFAVDPATAATCDAPATASVGMLEGAGCTVGPVEVATYTDDDGVSLDFQFVCHGTRSEIIAVIARIGEHLITASP